VNTTTLITDYYLTDALGSVRQLTNGQGNITLANAYDPYGTLAQTAGSAQTSYGFTGEFTDPSGMVYLRARYYSSGDGRFLTRDTWMGDYNRPLSLNRWMYVEGNPVNYADPSGHSPNASSQILSRALSQYSGSTNSINIFDLIIDCLPVSGAPGTGNERLQIDLTGYLALAMTKHGQDARVKMIANTLVTANLYRRVNDVAGTALWLAAYLGFNELEGDEKEWDIKIKIQRELGKNIVLCGTGINCHWFDYSTPGNIHFGYIAGLAKIDQFVAAIAGGALEQKDLHDKGLPLEPLYCFRNAFPGLCDNPQDQAAVDFGYELAKKYRTGISDAELRRELQINGMGNFQTNPHNYDEYWWQVYPETNHYGADAFNQ
jgi:RHS repeat-associated protein